MEKNGIPYGRKPSAKFIGGNPFTDAGKNA